MWKTAIATVTKFVTMMRVKTYKTRKKKKISQTETKLQKGNFKKANSKRKLQRGNFTQATSEKEFQKGNFRRDTSEQKLHMPSPPAQSSVDFRACTPSARVLRTYKQHMVAKKRI